MKPRTMNILLEAFPHLQKLIYRGNIPIGEKDHKLSG
jgi:hypothetical protein